MDKYINLFRKDSLTEEEYKKVVKKIKENEKTIEKERDSDKKIYEKLARNNSMVKEILFEGEMPKKICEKYKITPTNFNETILSNFVRLNGRKLTAKHLKRTYMQRIWEKLPYGFRKNTYDKIVPQKQNKGE